MVQQAVQIEDFVILAGIFEARIRIEIVVFKLHRADSYDTIHTTQGKRVQLVTHLNHQRSVDRHRERQTHNKTGTLAGIGDDLHRSSQFAHLTVNHVHAHTATGNLGYFVRCGESRLKNKLDDILIIQRAVLGNQTLLNRSTANGIDIEPPAVIR